MNLLLTVPGAALGRISPPPCTDAGAESKEGKESGATMAPPSLFYLTLWGSDQGGSFATPADAALLKTLNTCATSRGWTVSDFLRHPMNGVGATEKALSKLVRSVAGQVAAQRRASLAKQEAAARFAGSHSGTSVDVSGYMFGVAALCPTPVDLD